MFNLTSFFIKVLSGGSVGYITNLLAIKMLFRKFPLIGGGVILETYEELKDSLSDLVERELVNHNTIKSELSSEKFNLSLNKLIEHLINYSVDENLKFEKLDDFPGSKKSIDNLSDFIKSNESELTPFLKKFFNDLNLSSLFNDKQLDNIVDFIFKIIKDFVENDLLDKIILIYEKNNHKTIKEFIPENLIKKLSENFNEYNNDLHLKIKDHEIEIDKLIDNLYDITISQEVIEEITKSLENKTIFEIIGQESGNNLSNELLKRFIIFINSHEGAFFLQELSKTLERIFLDIERPLFSFLSSDLEIKLTNFLENNLPFLAKKVTIWLRVNKTEIEDLIENTIDEYYSEQKDVLGVLKGKLKETIGIKIAENFKIVEKSINKLEGYINDAASGDITKEVLKFLKEKNLGDVVKDFNIDYEVINNILISLINEYIPKIDLSIFDAFFEKRLEELIKTFRLDLLNFFQSYVKSSLKDQIKDKFIFTDRLTKLVNREVNNKLFDFQDKKISEVIAKSDIESYHESIKKYLDKNEKQIKEPLKGFIKTSLNNLNYDSDKKEYFNKIIDYSKEKISFLNIKSIYDQKIKDKPDINQQISKSIRDKLDDNLEKILEGRVSKAVNQKLRKLSAEELRDKVEDFMGRELKPITVLGAGLGATAGITMFLADYYNLVDFNNSMAIFFILPFIYALTGIGTNWLALKMLFQPYEAKKVFGIKVPFTPGVVGHRKSSFAKSMGKFVSNHLVTEETMDNIANEETMLEINHKISKNNYQFVDDLLNENKTNISNNLTKIISEYIVSEISENEQKYIDLTIDKINDVDLNKLIDPVSLKNKLLNKNNIAIFIETNLAKIIESNKSINDLPESLLSGINNNLSTFVEKRIFDILTMLSSKNSFELKLKEYLDDLGKTYTIKISDFLPIDIQNEFRKKSVNYISETFRTKMEASIYKYVQKRFIEEELSPDKKIKSLYDGELVPFIRKNIFYAIDTLLFDVGLDKLKQEKQSIAQAIISDLKNANKGNYIFEITSFFRIDKDIKNIIHLLIDNKLEPYLNKKKNELENILFNYIDFISEKKLSEVGLSNDVLNKEKITDFLNNLLKNDNIIFSIENISSALISDLLNIDLKTLIEIIFSGSFENLFKKLDTEFNSIKEKIITQIKSNDKNIIENISGTVHLLFEEILYKISTKDLMSNIAKSEIEDITKIALDLLKNQSVDEIIRSLFEKIILANKNQIIDIKQFEEDLAKLIKTITENKDLIENLKLLLIRFSSLLLENINNIADQDLKDYLLSVFSNSLVSSFKTNSISILDSINIREVVEREINNMQVQEIEKMFNSFAKPYFNKLILYGWLGGLIGFIDAGIETLK